MSPFHRKFTINFKTGKTLFFNFIEDENAPAIPTLDDHEAQNPGTKKSTNHSKQNMSFYSI
jgi:hypothetical protein